jgi:hypothetical protein
MPTVLRHSVASMYASAAGTTLARFHDQEGSMSVTTAPNSTRISRNERAHWYVVLCGLGAVGIAGWLDSSPKAAVHAAAVVAPSATRRIIAPPPRTPLIKIATDAGTSPLPADGGWLGIDAALIVDGSPRVDAALPIDAAVRIDAATPVDATVSPKPPGR